jgi:hypothetical protein
MKRKKNNGPRVGDASKEQAWFKVRRRRQRKRNQMAKESRRINRGTR